MSCRPPSGGRKVLSGDIFGMDDIIGIIESDVGSGFFWIFGGFGTSKFLPRVFGMYIHAGVHLVCCTE